MVWLFTLMEELVPPMVKTLAGCGAVARSLDGRIYIMFGPVIITEARLAYAGATIHSNNKHRWTLEYCWGAIFLSGTMARLSVVRFHAISWFQARCLYLPGHSPITGERASRSRMSAFFYCKASLRLRVYHAAHLRAESGKWARASWRRAWCPWIWCRSKTSAHVGHAFRCFQFVFRCLSQPLRCLGKVTWCQNSARVCLPTPDQEWSVLFHTVSLRDLLRFQFCFLDPLLFCRLAQSMQTSSVVGSSVWQWRPTDSSSTSTRSTLLISPDYGDCDEHNMWNPCWDFSVTIKLMYLMESFSDETVLGRIACSCRHSFVTASASSLAWPRPVRQWSEIVAEPLVVILGPGCPAKVYKCTVLSCSSAITSLHGLLIAPLLPNKWPRGAPLTQLHAPSRSRASEDTIETWKTQSSSTTSHFRLLDEVLYRVSKWKCFDDIHKSLCCTKDSRFMSSRWK